MFPFKIKMTNDEETMLAFNRHVLKKRLTVSLIIMGLFMLFWILALVYQYAMTGIINVLVIICFVLYTAYFVYLLLTPLRVKRNIRKQLAKSGVSECEYEFFEDRFIDNYANALSSGTETRSYKDLVKVDETDEFFYLFSQRAMAYVIRKSAMTKDQASALRIALSRFIPEKKYKILEK